MLVRQARANVLKMLNDGRYQDLYYLLMDVKLISEMKLIEDIASLIS